MLKQLERHWIINRNKIVCYRKTQNVLESENQEHKRQLETERWRAHAAAEKARDMIKVANQNLAISFLDNESWFSVTS